MHKDTTTKVDTVKSFQLVKHFTFISLVVVFVGTLILSVLFTHWVRTVHRTKSEDYARLLIANLNHQVFYQFNIPVAWKFEKIQLRNKEQFELMDNVVRNALHSFQVDMVNIYNLNNVISYSFDHSLIGKKDVGGTTYQRAVLGETSSKLVQRGSFWEMLLGFPKEVKIITMAPLRAENPTLIFVKGKGIVFSPLQQQTALAERDGPVLGVFEVVRDITGDYRNIFQFQKWMVLSCTSVMGIIFLVLRLLVKRGEAFLERRAREQLELKEKLSRAERLSALGELTAGISHEIRNPLGIIRSSAELLKKKMDRYEPANPVAGIIVEESGRLNTIITDFLNFAVPRTPHLSPVRVSEVIEKNLTFLAPRLKEQQVLLETRIERNLPVLMADPNMLYQAFLNILINALQAMKNGGRILVRANRSSGGVSIHFEDSGPGICSEYLGKVWDPFFTTKETGSGLGLGIVRNIIKSHGGEIHITNKPEGGAAVSILLTGSKGVDNGNGTDRR